MEQVNDLGIVENEDFPEYDYKKISELLFKVASELFRLNLLSIDIMDDSVSPEEIVENIALVMKISSNYLGIEVVYKKEDMKDFIYKVLDFQEVNGILN